MLGAWALFVTAIVSRQSLPAPTRLLVEYLDGSAPIISTRRPRFSFVPHPQHDHPGDGMAMSAYQIVVSRTTDGAIVWDSSVVNASSATSVKCGADLDALQTYHWTARWWANDAQKSSPSPTSTAKFVVGPCSEADWKGSRWVGGGLNEFRITFNRTTASDTLVFVASPGGSLLYTRNPSSPSSSPWAPVGKDVVGVSPWTDFRKMVTYRGYIVPQAKTASSVQQLKLAIGSGFWAPSYQLAGPFWGLPAGKAPVARVMVLGGVITNIEGRHGVCVSDDPWEGAVMDWGLRDADGWKTPPPVPDTPGWRPMGSSVALQAPYAATSPDVRFGFPVRAVSVTVLAPSPASPAVRRVLYKFDRNIVGHAAVRASAVTTSTEGNLTLRHCEVLNVSLGEENSFCLALRHLPDQPDTHMFPKGYRASSPDDLLSPRFTWHGFQYVIVEVTQGVDFEANIDSLVARWTASDLEDTASIEFAGPGAQQLSQIRDIVKASQVSNMAAFSPTDCPTREKHYWMGDAAVTAEEAMYNYFTPGICYASWL